jgi:2-oxoglutarate dehydrogenase E1 component
MSQFAADFGFNQALVEELFLQYLSNPASVSDAWRSYFAGLPPEALPQLTSPGFVRAPVAAAPAPEARHAAPATNGGGNGHGPGTNGSNGNGARMAAQAAAAMTYPPLADDAGEVSASVYLPPEAELVPFIERRSADRQLESFPTSDDFMTAATLQGRVSALVNAFRVRGHVFAQLDPLGLASPVPDELLLERYGLTNVDPETLFSTGDMEGPPVAPLGDIVRRLKETYNRSIGVEFTFIEERDQRTWLQRKMESTLNRLDLSADDQVRILSKLTDAEIFEQFLHTNYVGAKRFSLEGAESLIPLLDMFVEKLADLDAEEIVIGMAHRGRLNVLVNILEKRVQDILAGFEDKDPEAHLGGGDVKYHLGYSVDRTTRAGKQMHLTLTFNPSHLEFVNPVVEGRVRAKQDRRDDKAGQKIVPLLIHGDAAFAGQGIVAETLNLAYLEGYRTGGTIHIVVNNQVGFTTNPSDSRSTRYCTDITRMLRCPVFHVNGEDPEAVAQTVNLAAEFRQKFHRDVVIDLYCYRKYGHNEADEPRYTQPVMYNAIDRKKSVRGVYVDRLVETGKITQEQAADIEARRRASLEEALQEIRAKGHSMHPNSMQGLWKQYRGGRDESVPDAVTGVTKAKLDQLLRKISSTPEGFTPNPKIARMFRQRLEAAERGEPVDWGTAEVLAYASLVSEGHPVRLSGQDVRRGTFSHRHAVVFDAQTGASYSPLANMGPKQGRLSIYDSALSEAGVLGFEFGYSLDSPDALVIWEAQFGDFVNGAQVITDQFLFSSEDKWERLSGLVMLLPHGFEGQGPEHSSARLERFLAQCAEDNIQVCNLTTPAQIFHCLRRQVLRPWRKPLIIMSPKSLLRHPAARSTLDELAKGEFERILKDPVVKPSKARRVILCSGKVYYDLLKDRDERKIDDVAIIRLEQLYPLRAADLKRVLRPYKDGTDLVWVQEEPWNMGAWFFMEARLPLLIGDRLPLRCISRPESASPATGSRASHLLEQERLVREALK